MDDRLRKELVDYVDELADPDFPRRNWRASKPHPAPGMGWPDYVDYFAIDNPFATAAEYNIGLRLRNVEEAKAIRDLATAIDALSKQVGYYAEPLVVLNHADWPNIVDLAQEAKEVLSA